MKENHIKTEEYELWIEDGIVYNVYSPNLKIDLALAKEITAHRVRLSDGIARPALTDARNGVSIDGEARAFWASKDGSHLVSAGAVVIENYIQRLLVNAFLTLNRPPLPSKIFTSMEDAIRWLSYFKSVN